MNYREHEVNKLDNFLLGWYMEDTTVCDKFIKYFHDNPSLQHEGTSGYLRINKEAKDSIDVEITRSHNFDGLSEYHKILQDLSEKYIQKYDESLTNLAWGLVESFNIQYYKPNGGFHVWHNERNGFQDASLFRHLVFMTYLNDVTDQGETEFLHQKLKIKPEKGLTLIWPVDWTFTHRGIASPTQDKIIATGWFSFVHDNQRHG